MPIQSIKDPQTGEERLVYVAPKGMAKQQQPQQQVAPQRRQQQAGPGGYLGAITALPRMVAESVAAPFGQAVSETIGSGVSAGVRELQRTKDVGKALQAGGGAYLKGLEQTRQPAGIAGRVMLAGAGRNIQGFSDTLNNVLAAAGMGQPTTAARPNAPLFGVMPALPEVKQSQGERFITDLLSFGAAMAVPGGAITKGAGALVTKIPQAGRLARATQAGINALKSAPIQGGMAGAKGLAQRAVGITAEGTISGAPASAVATFLFSDPHSGSFSDSVYGLVKGTMLDTPALRYLRSDPRDKGVEAQLKAAINDAVWGAPIGTAFGVVGEGGKQVLKRTAQTIFNTFRAAKKADIAKTSDAVEKAAEEAPPATTEKAPSAATVDVAAETVVERPLPPPPVKRVTGRRATAIYAEMRREPLWEQQGPEFQQRLELQQPAQQAVPEAPAKAAEPIDVEPIADPWADAELAQKELLRDHQDLQTEIARTMHTTPEPVAPIEGQLAELAAPAYREVATVETTSISRDPVRFQYKELGRTKTGRSGSLVDNEAYNPDLAGVISVWRDPADGKTYVVNGHNRLDLAQRTGYPTVNVRYIQANNAAEARVKGAMQNIAEGQGTPVDAAKVMRDGGMSPEQMVAAGVSPRGRVMADAIPLSRLPRELFDQVATGRMGVDMGVAIGSSNADEQIMRDLAAMAKKGKWSAAKTAEAAEIARFATTTEVRDPNALPLPGFDVMASSNFGKLLEVRLAVKGLLRQEINALAAAANTRKAGILEAAGNVIDTEASQAARTAAMQEAEVFGRLANMRGPLSDALNALADQVTGKKKAADVVAANIDQVRAALDEEINGPRLEAIAAEPAPVEPAPRPEAIAAEPTPAKPAPKPEAATPRVQIPPAASRPITARTDESRVLTAAESLMNWTSGGVPGEKQAISSIEQAIDLVRSKGAILDPDAIPSLDMDAARSSKSMGRSDAATDAVAAAYRQFYGLPEPAPVVKAERPGARPAGMSPEDRRQLDQALKLLPAERRDEVVRQLESQGQIVSNPNPIGKEPVVPVAKEEPAPPVTPATFELPEELAKASNRYNYGRKAFTIEFASDLDRTAYYLAGDITGKPSRSAAKYRAALEAAGLDPKQVAEYGAAVVKPKVKEIAKVSESGAVIQISNQGFGGNELSLDLPPALEGSLGADYTGRTQLEPADKDALLQEAYRTLLEEASRVAGRDVTVQFPETIEGVFTRQQAAAYGDIGLVGKRYSAGGAFSYDKNNPADDLIEVAMFSRGRFQLFSKRLQSLYHEAFHRVQLRFLTDQEKAVLKAGDQDVRKLAAKAVPALAELLLNPQHPQRIGSKEAEAMAFSIWYKVGDEQSDTAIGRVFKKIAKLIDATGNWLTGRGFQTWDDVFERAYQGELAERGYVGQAPGPLDEAVGPQSMLAVTPPDPEEFARRVAENVEALRNGDARIEDMAATAAEDLRVRRIMSPSGNTAYISNAPEELIAANKALQDVLVERMDLTGIPPADLDAIFGEAVRRLQREGMNVDGTLQRVEAARRGDPRSQEDLIAQAALIVHRDHVLNQNAITALEFQNAMDDVARADAMARLWAGLEDQTRLDVADATISRKDAQSLALRQGRTRIDPTLQDLPAGTILRHGTEEESGQAILRDGFQASGHSASILGKGVYFTTDGMYSGAYGPVEVYGDLPGDVKILDLIATNRSIEDIIKSLGAGGLDEDGLISNQQKLIFRNWVIDNGYSGVRYDATFTGRPRGQADEVVIYDVNAANRVVGSDASIEPPAPDVDPVAKTIEDEVANPDNSLFNRLPEDVQQSIRDGELTAEAEQITETLARVIISGRTEPGVTKKVIDNASKLPPGYLTQDAILQLYRSALLWSPKTWYKMFFGSAYRAATLPIAQAAGALYDAGVGALKRDPGATYRALRRANLSMQIYGQYAARSMNAFRLMGHALKEGESLMNLGRNQFEVAQRGFTENEQMRLAGSVFEDTKVPENTLDSPFFVNPESTNLLAIGVRYLWKGMQVSGRVASSLDTFYSALVGPSAEWARFMDESLEQADLKGLQGDEAWKWAADRTDQLLDQQLRDVVVNGTKIKDGALTGLHAKTVMDWVNFTDDITAKFQDRSYQYGVRVARNEGLADPAEINARAVQWMQEGPGQGAKIGMGVANTVSLVPRVYQDAVNHAPLIGMIQPFNRGPANIIKASMRASGFAAPLADTWWRDIHSEDFFTRERAIGEIAVGYMTLTAGIALATSGYVQFSGPGSANPQVRQKMERMGYQPYSMRVKNPATGEWSGWTSLAPMDTLSNVFSIIGGYAEHANNVPIETREVLVGNALLVVAETIRQAGAAQFTKSMYEGIKEIMDLATEAVDRSFVPERGRISPWSAYVEKKLAGFVPSIARNMRNGFDPYKRVIPASDAPWPFNVFQETLARVANQIPGLSATMPPDLHPITGEPITVEQVWGTQFIPPDQPWLRGLVQAISPTSAFPYREGARPIVDDELARLSGRGTSFVIWTPNEFDGYRLTHEELNGPEGLKAIGASIIPPGRTKPLADSLEDLVTSTAYLSLPEPEPSKASESARAMLINDEINHYKRYAKEAFLGANPQIDEEIRRVTGIRAGNQYQARYGTAGTQSGTAAEFTQRYTR